MENGFVSNPGASKWITTAPGPGLVRQNVKDQKRMQLLQEAASLVPSQQEMLDELSKHKLAGGDNQQFQSMLNQQLTGFLNKYQDNPYYAFSREGKENVVAMRNLVNHPILGEAALAHEQSMKARTLAEQDKNLHKYNVTNGLVSAFDTKNKQIAKVSWDALNETYKDDEGRTVSKYEPMTVEDEIGTRDKLGFFDNENQVVHSSPAYNMVSFDKVVDGINNIIGKPGSNEYNRFIGELDGLKMELKSKTNKVQLQHKLNAVLQGLPNEAKDVLLATAFERQRKSGVKPDERSAYSEVESIIRDIAAGELQTSELMDVAPTAKAKAAGAGAGSLSGQQNLYESLLLGVGAPRVQVTVTNPRSATGKTQVVGQELNPSLFSNEKGGVPVGQLPFDKNEVFQVMKGTQGQLRTRDNGLVVDPALTIPAPNPNAIQFVDPVDGKTYIEMDVLSTDSHSDTDWSDKEPGITELTPEERQHWETIGEKTKQLSDDGKLMSPFRALEAESWMSNEDQYRVRVRFPYNSEAPTLARMKLDGLGNYVDKSVETISKTPPTTYGGIEYP